MHIVKRAIALNTWTEVEVFANGTSIEVLLDGAVEYRGDLSQTYWTSGYPVFEIGILYSGPGAILFDDVRATPVGPE